MLMTAAERKEREAIKAKLRQHMLLGELFTHRSMCDWHAEQSPGGRLSPEHERLIDRVIQSLRQQRKIMMVRVGGKPTWVQYSVRRTAAE